MDKRHIVIVSGLPRSGTSLVMKLLEAGGVATLTDNLRAADPDNPVGYYEFERVKKLKEGDFAWLPDAQGKAVKVISGLISYLPPGYPYKVIFMLRNLDEVLASQRQMLINRGENPDKTSDQDLATLFEKHLAQIKAWLGAQPTFCTLYVNYRDLVMNPEPGVCQINEYLGGQLKIEKMMAVVDPNLYRQRR